MIVKIWTTNALKNEIHVLKIVNHKSALKNVNHKLNDVNDEWS